MSWLPKSPKARRRLTLVAAIAPVLAIAVALTLWGLKNSISFFYTPSQADAAKPPPGRSIQLGGLVSPGSVVKHSDGRVDFVVADKLATDKVTFQGDLPDLFREGQGIVAVGAFRQDGVFEAKSGAGQTRRTLHAQGDRRRAQGTGRMARRRPGPGL